MKIVLKALNTLIGHLGSIGECADKGLQVTVSQLGYDSAISAQNAGDGAEGVKSRCCPLCLYTLGRSVCWRV